jgi:hypothetical protein
MEETRTTDLKSSFIEKGIESMDTRKWTKTLACLVSVILLITSHAIVAQEVRIGGVSISIPKRTKTPRSEETTSRNETVKENPASEGEGAKTIMLTVTCTRFMFSRLRRWR